ncbi:MAG: DNA repair protein RecN [Chloroflexota bacterium]|nr:MAG: DNA repair protein RecN [Chloroflexota bacterium]
MLVEITISNLAIIDELNLKFAPGFNVLTGETGAGKSIILDALTLLLGGRAQSELIRAGAAETRVEGIFLPSPQARALLEPELEENGITLAEDTLILARELHRAGRATGRINGRAVTGAVLQQIGDKLVDIHGQSEHLSLLRPKEHIDLLDRYGNLWEQRVQVAKLARQLRKTRQELRDLQKDARETARKIDRLTFIIQEIGDAKLKTGQEAELKTERDLLAHAETRATLADEAYHALYGGGDEENGALDLLNQARQAVRAIEKYDPEIKTLLEQTESAGALMDDVARTLRGYRDSIEFNPKRLEQIEDRLDLIFRLKRKYGDTIEQILEFGKTSQQELDAVTHSEERMNELRAQEAKLVHDAGALAENLSQARQAAAATLARGIENELQDLGMQKAKFAVALNRVPDANGLGVGDKYFSFDSTGIDKVEFMVSPNPGEPLKPLAKIASGGETSRLMLALKAVLGAADRTPTLIFDEIDQGIGGRVGAVVGKKLWNLTATLNGAASHTHQVICITHLPQIAAYGDEHFHIRKQVVGEHTVTHAQALEARARLDELAGMLGAVTDTNRASAQELLTEAAKNKMGAEF